MATKFEAKSAISWLVYEVSRRSLRPTGGFRGRAIKGCQKNFTTTDPRCYSNEIWDKIGYNWLVYDISPRCLRLTGGFGDQVIKWCQSNCKRTTPVAMATKCETSRPPLSRVTWLHLSRDHLILSWPFPIDAPLSSSLYLQLFLRYWAISTLGLRTWVLRVTWRRRSRDHLIPRWPFPMGALLSSSLYLQLFSRYRALSILGSRPWTFRVTWRHRSHDRLTPK